MINRVARSWALARSPSRGGGGGLADLNAEFFHKTQYGVPGIMRNALVRVG